MSEGNTTGCEFQDTITWGDGSPSTTQAYPGGPDGTTLAKFRHTYANPGVYTIIDTAQTTVGYCGAYGGTLHFTFDGAFTVSGSDLSTLGQAGKQETGSPADAKICGTASGQFLYRADEALGNAVVKEWQDAGLTTASYFLTNFLSGTGSPIAFSSTSPTAAEVEGSAAFTKENNDVLSYIQQQLDSGVTQVQLPTPRPLHALAFLSDNANADLYLAFRYTHKINVSGAGRIVGSHYTGSLTYVIGESYGFNKDNVLFGVGLAMRHLQTVCGAPYYPGGAHWFPVSVTVTVPFSLPRLGSAALWGARSPPRLSA